MRSACWITTVNDGEIVLYLTTDAAEPNQVRAALRTRIAKLPDAMVRVGNLCPPVDAWPGEGMQIVLRVRGEDMEELRTKANQLKDRIGKVPGVVDLDRFAPLQQSLSIKLDRAKLAQLALGVREVMEMVELASSGTTLGALATKALPYCPEDTSFNQGIVTHYPANSGIGWHVDAPRFGDCIIAVSLGGEGRLQFRADGEAEVCCEVLTASGSLYVMHGPARWEYQHQVVPVVSVRYSLTFRFVAR